MRNIRTISCFLLLLPPVASAQWVQTNGPNASGGVNCFVVLDSMILAGTSPIGVYRTVDTMNWTPANTGLTQQNVLSLAVTPDSGSGSTLFAGTLLKAFRSTDAGGIWSPSDSGLTNPTVYALSVNTSGIGGVNLYAGTFGGVFRSTDVGTTWSAVNSGLTHTTVWGVASKDTFVFAGTAGGGVFRSSNNMVSWIPVNSGLTSNMVLALGVKGLLLFAATLDSGVYLSDDDGASWVHKSVGLPATVTYGFASTNDIVFAATDSGIFMSTNDGESWNAANAGFLPNTQIWAIVIKDSILFAGSAAGVVWKRHISEMVPLPDTGLVAYYPFNGNANDESGNTRHGTAMGATLTSDRFGNPNSAYAFDGDDYIVAGANGLPTAGRTVSVWFNANSLSSRPVALGYGGGSCGTSFFMELTGCGGGGYGVTSHCNVNSLLYNYAIPPVLAWHHFVIVTDSAGTRMYVDGALVTQNAIFINNTSVINTDLALGVDVSPGGIAPYTDGCVGYLDGALDDVRIYNVPLTNAQVLSLYNEGGWPLGNSTVNVPLIGGWNMVSNPVTRSAGTDSVSQLFPGSLFPYAYRFDPGTGYQLDNTMENGVGYWAKFAGTDTAGITGGTRPLDTLTVSAGWNMVGSISQPAAVDSIIQIPPGIISTSFFGYTGAYTIADTLRPGQAYFVKAGQPGQLVLK